MTITIEAMPGGFGANISHIDLQADVSLGEARELRAALDTFQLLRFRAEGLTAGDHARLVRTFGPICNEVSDGSDDNHGTIQPTYVSNLTTGNRRLLFHSDFAWTEWPLPVISLYGSEVSGEVVPTYFVNGQLAYDRLPKGIRDRVKKLSAVNAYDMVSAERKTGHMSRVRVAQLPLAESQQISTALHPVVKPHPRTGSPILFVNELMTSHIEDLDAETSEALLTELFAILYAEEHMLVHHWSPGDLVIWDNVALQHARSAPLPSSRRILRRIVVSERTMSELMGGRKPPQLSASDR